MKPEESLEEREVQLSRGRPVRGRVVDGRTGDALEFVKVVLRTGQDWQKELAAVGWGSLDYLKGVQSKLTAPDGMFSFQETEPGILFLHTRRNPGQPAAHSDPTLLVKASSAAPRCRLQLLQ